MWKIVIICVMCWFLLRQCTRIFSLDMASLTYSYSKDMYYFGNLPFTGKAKAAGVKNRFKKGKFHGLNKGYYSNGQLQTKITFKDGERDGLSESYYSNGQLQTKGTANDGELDSIIEMYDENGESAMWRIVDGHVVEFSGQRSGEGVKKTTYTYRNGEWVSGD